MLSIKGKDDYNNIEAQLREYQRKMESMSRDISNKDSLNRQLKNKIKTLEDDFEQSRQDLNSCIISRDSLQQQKLDVERELKVNIYALYACFLLTHFNPVLHFYTPWKRQKTKGFLTFSGGAEMWHWTKMG